MKSWEKERKGGMRERETEREKERKRERIIKKLMKTTSEDKY